MKYCYKSGNKVIHTNKKPVLKNNTGKHDIALTKVKGNKYIRRSIKYITKK